MAISPLGAVASSGMLGSGATPKLSFEKLTPSAPRLENAPQLVKSDPARAVASAGKTLAAVSRPVTASSTATTVINQVNTAQAKMDSILKLAESGKSFSPAELLSLQAHVYRASQELDLAGKVVEKATGGVKQVLQTQV